MLHRAIGFGLLLACVSLAAQVREKETSQTREEKVRDTLEKFNLASQQKDSDTVAKLVTSDVTVFAGGKAFTSWEDYRDNFLNAAFSRPMPPSTWEVQKMVTAPDMAWAYTKTHYNIRRQGQPVEADLYQVFVLQKTAAPTSAKASTSSAQSDWRIALIDYTFHRESLAPQLRPDSPHQGSQPK